MKDIYFVVDIENNNIVFELLQENEITFEVEKIVGVMPEIYTGAYQVTPKAFEETILDTDNKLMTDDVTVYEIPYAETSNTYGTTVTIAS